MSSETSGVTEDPNRYTPEEAREAVESCYKLASKQAKAALVRTGLGTYQDYYQAAILGLCDAAARFRKDNGNKYVTYATWYVRKHVREEVIHQAARGFHVPKDNQIYHLKLVFLSSLTPEENDSPFELGGVETPRPEYTTEEREALWSTARAILPRRECAIMELHLRHGRTLEDISIALRMTRGRTTQIMQSARERLQRHAGRFRGYYFQESTHAAHTDPAPMVPTGTRAPCKDDRDPGVHHRPRRRRA